MSVAVTALVCFVVRVGSIAANVSRRENPVYLSFATGIGCAIILAMTVIFLIGQNRLFIFDFDMILLP